MKTTKYIWMNGRFRQWKDAKIHVVTHALHYGGAVFEGIRVYNTKDGPAIFRLKDHLRRLKYSAETIGMKMPFPQKKLVEKSIELIKKNKIKDGYLRPLVYYGYGKMGLNPKGAPVDMILACWPWKNYLSDVPAIKVKIPSFIRLHPDSVVPDAKISGYYSNSILASLEVRKKGYHEALFLDYKGNIAEGPGENFFIVKNGKIYTPPTDNILPGLTRDCIMVIARDLGFSVEEKHLKPKDVYEADECFMTGTASEVAPIEKVDKHKIGRGGVGPVTAQLKKVYEYAVHGKIPTYKKWLTYV